MKDFSFKIDIYTNMLNIYLINKEYENKPLQFIVRNGSEIIYKENFLLAIEFFFFTNKLVFSNLNFVTFEIHYNDIKIYDEEFRFRDKYNPLKMPAVRVYNVMGLGDLMTMTPAVKKLHEIYKQKVTIILSSHRAAHNNLVNEYFIEFIKNNPHVNKVFNWDTFTDPENKYEIYHIFDSDWNAYYYCDLKQLCASKCGFTLKEDELNMIYVPDEYIPIDLPKEYVCISPAIRGPERSWDKDQWQKLVNILNKNNIPVVSIGRDSGEDIKHYYNLDIELGMDLCGKDCQNSLSQTWYIINNSNVFVTFDTGLYIFAGTTDTHILLCGWPADPFTHQSYRKGSKYYKFSHIRGNCNEFCLNDPKWDLMEHGNLKLRHPGPTCELGINYACKPSVDQVFSEIMNIY